MRLVHRGMRGPCRACRSLSTQGSGMLTTIARVNGLLTSRAEQAEHKTLDARLSAIVSDEEERRSQPRPFSLPEPPSPHARNAPVWQGSWGRYFATRDGFQGDANNSAPPLDLRDHLLLQSLTGAFSCMLTAQAAVVACSRAGVAGFPQPGFPPFDLMAQVALEHPAPAAASSGADGSSQRGTTAAGGNGQPRLSKAAAKRARRAGRNRKRSAPGHVAAAVAADQRGGAAAPPMSQEGREAAATATAAAATPLYIHVIGASHQELALIPTFWPELAHLLPGYDVRLLFVGPDVPIDHGAAGSSSGSGSGGDEESALEQAFLEQEGGLNAFVPAGDRLSAALCHGMYSPEVLASASPPLPAPHLCVLFNSGMGTESAAWRATMDGLLRQRVPVCSTSFDAADAMRDDAFLLGGFGVPQLQQQAAAEAGVDAAAAAGGGAGDWRYVVEPQENPFGSMMPEISQNDNQRIIRSNAFWRLFVGAAPAPAAEEEEKEEEEEEEEEDGLKLTAAEAKKMTVPNLKAALESRGLDAKGLKAVLLKRLLAAL